jgi:2-C-methyl-D-erythritol 2,4-cyclodiphosphate synthase
MFRVGIGYDIHRLVKGRPLILGGVELPHSKGLAGHSDADVLAHAVCDALLGALALGDIGHHFPSGDPKYKGISSLRLLKRVAALVAKRGYAVENVDSMVLLEAPRLAPFKDRMRRNIAQALGLRPEQVSVKATTHEGVGEIGRGRAACAHAVALVKKTKKR